VNKSVLVVALALGSALGYAQEVVPATAPPVAPKFTDTENCQLSSLELQHQVAVLQSQLAQSNETNLELRTEILKANIQQQHPGFQAFQDRTGAVSLQPIPSARNKVEKLSPPTPNPSGQKLSPPPVKK
jgi:hypothetical protein